MKILKYNYNKKLIRNLNTAKNIKMKKIEFHKTNIKKCCNILIMMLLGKSLMR